MSDTYWFDQFIATVRRLAESPESQRLYLKSLGMIDIIDELALEFDDYFAPYRDRLESVSTSVATACRRLDSLLDHPDLGWTFEDLASPPWADIRAQAQATLKLLVEARDQFPDAIRAISPAAKKTPSRDLPMTSSPRT